MKNILYPIIFSILFVSLFFIFFEELEIYFTDVLMLAREKPESYALLSFGVLSADILLPVPSSLVMYYNGLVLGFVKGTGISLLSLIVSGTIGYWIGYSSAMGLSAQKDKNADQIIQKYGGLGIIITRGIPILSESICFAAGYNRMDFKKYTLLNLVGAIPIAFIYGWFGAAGNGNDLFYYSFGLSILVSAVFYLTGKKLMAKTSNKVIHD